MNFNFQTQDDQLFLKNYTAAFNLMYGAHGSAIAYIKDSSFSYQSGSPQFMQLLDCNISQLVGKTDYQIERLQSFASVIDVIRTQDTQICNQRKMEKFLYITPQNNAYIAQKSVIINPTSNNVVGIYGQLSNFALPHPIATLCQISSPNADNPIVNEEEYTDISQQLTERRHMILFLCIQRYSAAEISEILATLGHSISVQRVHDHVNKLKYIFMVRNKEELISKAIQLNYHRYFPHSFLQVGSYPLNDKEILISSR